MALLATRALWWVYVAKVNPCSSRLTHLAVDDKADIGSSSKLKSVATAILVNFTLPGHKSGQKTCYQL